MSQSTSNNDNADPSGGRNRPPATTGLGQSFSVWSPLASWLWGGALLASSLIGVVLSLRPELLSDATAENTLTGNAVAAIFMFLSLVSLVGFVHTVLDWRRRVSHQLPEPIFGALKKDVDAWFVTDLWGDLLQANEVFGRLFPSVAAAGNERRNVTLLDITEGLVADKGARERFRQLAAEAAGGRAGSGEFLVYGEEDKNRWLELSASPIGKHLAFVGGVLWRVRDVTERKQSEIASLEKIKMFSDLLNNMPVGYFAVNADGRFRYVNRLMAEWLGGNGADLVSGRLGLADFVAENAGDGAAYGGELGGGQHGEIQLRSADGRTFPVYLHQSMKEEENGEFLYSRSVALRDLVPRAKYHAANGEETESNLDVSLFPEERQWLYHDAPTGIILVDQQGKVLRCNRAFVKLLGLHQEAVIGQPISTFVSQEDRDQIAANLSKLVMGTARAVHMELSMIGASEREVTVSVFAGRVSTPEGDIRGAVLHFIDTTEYKHLEQQFTQSQKMQAVGLFTGGVAHDFNNLLTAMQGFCDLLLDRHTADDPSFFDIMQIKQNVNRATDLVKQLLAYSRKQTLRPKLFDINTALSKLSNLLRRLIGETITLTLEPTRSQALILADPGQFDQVIVNLAVNARDAMAKGGDLTIRAKTVTLDANLERGAEVVPAGNYVVVEVIDTGSGISKDDLGSIFEPYFTTKDKERGEGTGLGLSTVQGIVHQSNGYIFVDSAPGEGTSFRIYFPRHEEGYGVPVDRSDDEEEEAARDLTGSGAILLVEDDEAVRIVSSRTLTNRGYKLISVADGEQALEAIQRLDTPLDLIISDVVMPGMDGQTLIHLIRQELPQIRAILISGYAEDTIPEGIASDPSIHFLAKPFSLDQLAATVKNVLAE